MRRPRAAASGAAGGFGAAIERGLREGGHASNWELVSAKHSASGHPIAVMGPQVGYFIPQILMEEDLHGPGIDARGAAFAGVNLYVELGHGRDYAWSATTATSDNVDTFAEVLCRDKFHYVYRGKCKPMEKLVRTESWTPNAIDPTEAGAQTLTSYRTVHGIVFARGKVARAQGCLRAPAQHLLPRARLGGRLRRSSTNPASSPAPPASRKRSRTSTSSSTGATSTPNTSPTRSRGRCRSAQGTSPDFPILGTGQYDWKGFKPASQTADYLPFAKHPQAVDPPYLVSWNNKQAPEWGAADDQYDYGPLHRVQMISDKVRAGTKGKGEMTIAQLVQAMEEPATQDLRGYRLLPTIFKAVGKPKQSALRKALATLRAWHKAGAHRRDLNRDGVDEETPAIELMDAWWPKLVAAEFKPALGKKAYERLQGHDRNRRPTPAARPTRRTSSTAGGATPRRTCAPLRPEAEGSLQPRSTAAAAQRSAAAEPCSAASARR